MPFQSKSAEQTRQFGSCLALALQPGDVLLLTGDLGAGKSELARGIARGLGIKDRMPSPTFTFLNQYQGEGAALHHFDWYRVEDQEELYAAGLDEFITGDWISLIEWHQRGEDLLPGDCLELIITKLEGDARSISLVERGNFRRLEGQPFHEGEEAP